MDSNVWRFHMIGNRIMRKYTDFYKITITSNIICRNQQYFPDEETQQILTIVDNGDIVFQRSLFSGEELELTKDHISTESINEIFYALSRYLSHGDRPRVPDMGKWSCRSVDMEQQESEIRGAMLFGSNTRELHLSDFIRERIGIPRLYLLDGVPFHKLLPDRTRAIYEFSKKWIDIINHSPSWFTLMEDHMMEDLRSLYFEMDFGRTFEQVYREGNQDRGDPEILWENIPHLHNVDLLGSAICSQVYYYLRHADDPAVHFDEAEVWLNTALQRMYQLTKEVSY